VKSSSACGAPGQKLSKEHIMKKLLTVIALSSAFVVSAFAGEVSGVVKMYEDSTKALTLEDGTVYKVADGVTTDGVITGAKVKVTFDDTTKEASAVTVEAM
jgi:Protein of unknown function (DUF1344)